MAVSVDRIIAAAAHLLVPTFNVAWATRYAAHSVRGRLPRPGILPSPSDLVHLLCTWTGILIALDRVHRPDTVGRKATAFKPVPHPVQRRLRQTDIEFVTSAYQAGRSLRAIATVLAVHHDTVAAHLEQLGIARRTHERKMTADDVDPASRRYEAGDSLTVVGAAFAVDAATVRRELVRAGFAIRPRRGWPAHAPPFANAPSGPVAGTEIAQRTFVHARGGRTVG